MIRIVKRALARLRMRHAEIALHDLLTALGSARDKGTRLYLDHKIGAARYELAQARADYIALLPPGQRRTFDIA